MVATKLTETKLTETGTAQPGLPEAPAKPSAKKSARRFLVFGTAAGLEVGETGLRGVVVRGRPQGATVTADVEIANFRVRAPQDWGREFREFLARHEGKHLSATVLLPRRDVIVRVAPMAGVAAKDIPGALAFQIDSMHPYGEEAVAFAWTRADPSHVLVGVMRQSVLDGYVELFRAAGIAVAGFTFSASAIHSALRLYGAPPRDFAVFHASEESALEIYGESEARPVFSAEFELAPPRALALARAELRLPEAAVKSLASVLPQPLNVNPVEPLVYAAALASLGQWSAPYANLLPAEQRSVTSRARWIPTIVLAVMLAAVGVGWLIYAQIRDGRYLVDLEAQISRVQQTALRASALDRRMGEHRKRIELLDDYRRRTQNDIEILAELSRILPANAWTQLVEIAGDTVTLTGEADQAAPLLKILDSSPLFRNSEFSMGLQGSGAKTGEGFRIRTYRRVPEMRAGK